MTASSAHAREPTRAVGPAPWTSRQISGDPWPNQAILNRSALVTKRNNFIRDEQQASSWRTARTRCSHKAAIGVRLSQPNRTKALARERKSAVRTHPKSAGVPIGVPISPRIGTEKKNGLAAFAANPLISFAFLGRNGGIRTRYPLHPMQPTAEPQLALQDAASLSKALNQSEKVLRPLHSVNRFYDFRPSAGLGY